MVTILSHYHNDVTNVTVIAFTISMSQTVRFSSIYDKIYDKIMMQKKFRKSTIESGGQANENSSIWGQTNFSLID